jgi:dephospho-CoA kinase
MKRVAVFGNAGAGKSTLAMRLAELTGVPLYTLDTIQFRAGRYRPEEKDGGKVTHEEYLKIHADLLKRDRGSLMAMAVSRRHGSGSTQPIRSFTSTCPF